MKLKDYLYYSEDKVKLYNADCLDILKKLPDNYIDLIVTDPPYGYSFMGKDWDTFNEVKDIQKEFGNTVYAKKGFKKLPRNKPFGMIKFFVPIWKEVLRILKPGAFAFVMCAPRQDVLSKQIVALQEAGFETGFSSIYWSYATGFPKASNISKMVDKRGAVLPDNLRKFKKWFRKQIENSSKTQQQINKECGFTATSYYKSDGKDYWTSAFPTEVKWKKIKKVMDLSDKWDKLIKRYDKERGFIEPTGNLHQADKTKSIKFSGKQLNDRAYSKEAKSFDGSYGGFQPKPAVEIIIVAMKPLSEKTYVDQALKNGKGITWLDNCRVPYRNEKDIGNPNRGKGYPLLDDKKGWNKNKMINNITIGEKGRFPANLLVSDDVLNDGKVRKNSPVGHKNIGWKHSGNKAEKMTKLKYQQSYGDSGSYSRYFDLDKWWRERVKKLPLEVQKVFPYLIVPKASKREKNRGCENLEDKQQGLEAKNRVWSDKCGNCGLKFIGGEPRCHCSSELKKTDKKGGYQYKNNHPTVKPLKLMSYLITLGSKEGDIVLDPFTGSGTTLIVSKLLNRKGVGIEMSKEYCNIAKARVKGWSK